MWYRIYSVPAAKGLRVRPPRCINVPNAIFGIKHKNEDNGISNHNKEILNFHSK